MYLAYLTMQGFFRSFGLMFSSFHTAFRMSAIFVPNMIQYAGYMIPVTQMKRWLFWIVSNVSYCARFALIRHCTVVLHQPTVIR